MHRRPASPVVVIVCLSITVTMVLLVLWQWAAANTTVAAEPTIVATVDPTVALSTPLLSTRRAPGVLSRDLNVSQFRADIQPLMVAVEPTSCAAVSVDGVLVSEANGTTPVIPASNMKLVVAAVALDVLGPSYTFTTSVVGQVGPDGVVAGDLVLLGGGDPVLSTDWWPASGVQTYPPFDVTRLERLADQVQSAGVTRVDGRVVGDGTRYDDEFFNPSWDTDLHGVEGGPLDALLVNDGWMTSTIADVTADPALGAAQVFTGLLRDRGITVGQGATAGTAGFDTVITSVTSLPLSNILGEMLETSDDNTAEMLVKEIGLVVSGVGTTSAGLAVMTERLLAWGVPMDGVGFTDGSGLSRENRITCAALLAVLQHGDLADAVGEGLPIATTTGTLVGEFAGTEVEGTLRAKTGSLSGVKALSGYQLAAGGSVVEFALVLNQPGINLDGAYRPIWNELLAPALVTYPSAATPDQLAPR